MKSFLKKMNRGVALAIVLVIGLGGFLIVDAVTFSKEEPILKEFLEEYLQEYSQIILLPEQYREIDADIPDDVINAKNEESKKFIEKYFTEYNTNNRNYNNSSMQNITNGLKFIFQYNKDNGYCIKNAECSLSNISSIQKQGTNAVRINFKVNMKVSASPQAQYVFLTQTYSSVDNRYNNSTDSKNIADETLESDFTVILLKINGNWKIAEVQGGYYY